MSQKQHYDTKFPNILDKTGFHQLTTAEQSFIRTCAFRYQFTHQELKKVVDACLDLSQWQETPLESWWQHAEKEIILEGQARKKQVFHRLTLHLHQLKTGDKRYTSTHSAPSTKPSLQFIQEDRPGSILGLCPVASSKTLCCNLRTLDAVLNCGYQCQYCSIQSFFPKGKIIFHKNFSDKLKTISLDPHQLYHIGTGQSSDALMWGNKWGILDSLFDFATAHPNVFLELKTKSANVAHLCQHPPPRNIIISWSLNPEIIVENEEPGTASLESRLKAARRVADRGIKVGFHFHPLMMYEGWRSDYSQLVARLVQLFQPPEVAFVSMGTLTFSKPILRAIRATRQPTKVHQMPFAFNPEHKLTYPDSQKIDLFQQVYRCFSPWHKHVYFYLCMEEAKFWQAVFGKQYPDNECFENDFLCHLHQKVYGDWPNAHLCPTASPGLKPRTSVCLK